MRTGWKLAGWMSAVVLAGGAAGVRGLELEEVGRFDAATRFRDLRLTPTDVVGVTFGLSSDNGALRIFSGGETPGEMTAIPLNGPRRVRYAAGKIHVLYNYYYGGIWRSGVRTFDAGTLEEIGGSGTWWNSSTPGMDVVGDLAYLANANEYGRSTLGLNVFSFADDPAHPVRLGIYNDIEYGHDVRVVDELAYVADGSRGVKIIDVSDPTSPSLAGQWDAPSGRSVKGVQVEGNLVFAVGNGFWILDAFNPADPQLLASLDEEATSVSVDNGYAYVGGAGGLRVYHVDDPENPELDTLFRDWEGDSAPWPIPETYAVTLAPPDLVYMADSTGLIVLRRIGDVEPGVFVSLHRVDLTGVANLDAPLDLQNNPVPIIPVTDPDVLSLQPEVTRGLVADGVTPLLFKLEPDNLIEPIQLDIHFAEEGAVLSGGVLSRLQVLQDGSWNRYGSSITLAPGDGPVFLWLEAIQPWDLICNPGSTEATVALDLLDAQGGPYAGDPVEFAIRRPPVLLTSRWPWGADVVDEIRKVRPAEFILTRDYAFAIWSDLEQLQTEWAVTRSDLIAHGKEAAGVRGSMAVIGFRTKETLNRGWFRRIVSVGGTHNGSRLVPYLRAISERLRQGDSPLSSMSHLPDALRQIVSLAQGTASSDWDLDPRGFWISKPLNKPHDPAAKFHLIGCQTEDWESPLLKLVGLTGSDLRTVFPHGSDGLIGLPSQFQDGSLAHAFLMPGNLAHRAQQTWFPGATGQTHSPDIARHAMSVLDDPDEEPFALFVPAPLVPDSELERIAEVGLLAPSDFLVDLILMAPADPGPVRSRSATETYRYEVNPPPEAPLTGPVDWVAEAFGADDSSAVGLMITADGQNARQVTLTVDEAVEGDVVLYASYPTLNGQRVFARPVLLTSRPPEGATLTGIEIEPSGGVVALGHVIELRVYAQYSDGSRRLRWTPPDQLVIGAEPTGVIDVSHPTAWKAIGEGSTRVTLTWQGHSTEAELTVVNAYPPRTFEEWRGEQFTDVELADPSISGESVDLDGDGMDLVSEYVTAGDPWVWEDFSPMQMGWSTDGGAQAPVLVTRISSSLAGISPVVQRSSDLVTWIDYHEVTEPDGGDPSPVHEVNDFQRYRKITLELSPLLPPWEVYRLSDP